MYEELAEAGIEVVGENRAQDLLAKHRAYGEVFRWHFIGHLQSRKAPLVSELCELCHSLSSESAARKLTIPALVEVNLSGEETKSGVAPEEVEGLIALADVRGLMTMPPPSDDPEDSRPWFRRLRRLAEQHGLHELSMGTSQDYRVAAEEGGAGGPSLVDDLVALDAGHERAAHVRVVPLEVADGGVDHLVPAGADPGAIIHARLAELTDSSGGYEFAQVITRYWQGHDGGDDQLKLSAMRWLSGEFSTRADARQALGVRTIVDDTTWYDQLKLMSRFVRMAGYDGLLVCLDEMVSLYKVANAPARAANYEQLLRILNDCLQGTASSLGFLFGGTPDCSQCGCAISSGLHWIRTINLAGPLKIDHVIAGSVKVGRLMSRLRSRSARPSRWSPTVAPQERKAKLIQIRSRGL